MPAARWWRARRPRRSSRNSGRSPARSGRIRGDCRPSRARSRRSFVRRPVKWLVGVVAAVLVLVVAALILVPFLVDTPRVQALIASNASQALGRPVRFRSMSISVLPLPAVALHGLEIAEDPQFGTEPFLKLETGKVRLKLLPLLTGRVELGDVKLTKPVITVIQTADGRMNISTLGTGAGTKEPKAAERAPRGGGGTGGGGAALPAAISIEHGLVAYVARGKGGVTSQYRVDDLNLTLTGGAPQLAFKGDLKVKPGDLVVKIADGQVALDGGKPLTEAPLRGVVTLDGKDIGDLAKNALGPTPAFGGALKGKLALSGTLGAPAVAGDIELATPADHVARRRHDHRPALAVARDGPAGAAHGPRHQGAAAREGARGLSLPGLRHHRADGPHLGHVVQRARRVPHPVGAGHVEDRARQGGGPAGARAPGRRRLLAAE